MSAAQDDVSPDAGLPGLGEQTTWPRFEVIVFGTAGAARARYAVADHLEQRHQFPVNAFSREQANGLCRLLRVNALEKGEPVTVLRQRSAVSTPARPKKERPTMAPPKGGTAG